MDLNSGLSAGAGLIMLGIIMVLLRQGISQHVAAWYRKIGIDIPEDKYAKQFVFVGVMLIVLGFLAASGLIQYG